ncbi:SusC/RagA family TonB-linked outer membrane protein [Aureibaculum sp. 2210JD6-5]|uniref:SusC/RagA family TonB-linked outer membrane protein n=1 Tax=Aureibaculum sp. 2210JD6-5 TaxID=3103957 RepID=UPI002AAC5540|nr:SusC/RagA family TonB-linked outer membrane protein [Aureibaculum sp. 2210JD6-5]MDY7396818.1 SusC/RagA family TonB-linked outer membrane protein [Aureibaculum sp. 2210JD6-5]
MIRKLILSVFAILLTSSFVYAQRTVTGTVSDASGPLPGASVLVKGTTTGTITDFDGNFSIDVPDGTTTLVVSFLGYVTKETPVSANQSSITITLEEDAQALEEVVVNALGFKEQRDDVASTYSVIGAEDVLRAKEPTLINSLAGKASGVNITGSSADPGAGSRIQIRGVSSINGSDPLIVVDGIPINNSSLEGFGSDLDAGVSQQSRLNDINPDDIESIQVFKGASAGSIYGSRALGGVIVITTKRGKAGKLKASLGTTISIDQINRKHPLQRTFGQGSGGNYSPTNANSWGDRISDRSGGADDVNTSGQYFEAADGTIYYPINSGGKNSTDVFTGSNFDQIFQDGMAQDTKLNLSGGTEKATFYFGANHLDQEGIMRNSNYFKNSLSFGTTYKFNDWLNTSAKIAYTNSSSNRIQQGSNTAGLYLGLLRNPPDFDISDYIGTYYDNNGNPTPLRHRSYRRYLGQTSNPTYNNPLWTIFEQTSDTEVDRFLSSVDFNITATPWLKFVVRGGLDHFNDDRTYFNPMFSGDGANNGRYRNEFYKNTEISADFISLMNFNITEDLGLNLTVGAAINDRTRKQVFVEALDFLYNSRLQNPSISGNIDTQERNRKERNIRFYGQSAFEYKDLLNLNLGLTFEDASSSSKSIVYPSAEVGFKWSNLLDLDNDSALSFAKLRLAYGEVGLAPDPHAWETGYETATYTTYSDGVSLTAFGGGFRLNDDQGNPALEFEKKREYEIGLDLRFFKNRLSLSGTYYYNNTRDMILNVSLDPSSGFDSFLGNIGELENKGFELEFDYNFLKKEDIGMSLYGNYATNKNEMLDLKGFPGPIFSPGSSVTSTAIVGYPVGILTGSAALRNADGSLDLDANGFPQLDTSGDKVIGDPNPDWTGALGFRANYKNLSLNVLFETSQGHDIAERTRFVLQGFGTHAITGNEVAPTQSLVNYDGDVIPSGTLVRGNIQDFGGGPVLLDESWYTSLGGGFGSSVINEFAIGDASWTRLREISLSYSLDGDLIKKTGLESVQLSATGRNLVLWTNVDGIDPDISQFSGLGKGLDYFTNPSSKSFVFGITINY